MGQGTVLKFLEKYPDQWFYIEEVSRGIKVNHNTASVLLWKLYRAREVLRKEVPYLGKRKKIKYKFKEY